MIKILGFILLSVSTVWAEGERWIIGFNPGTSIQERHKSCETKGLKVIEDLDEIDAVVVEKGRNVTPNAFFLLKADPKIYDVLKDEYRIWLLESPSSLQEIPLPSLHSILKQLPQTHLSPATPAPNSEEVQWGVQRVNAPAVWNRTRGSGVKVAVIDTGIDPTHPDLGGRVAGGFDAISTQNDWKDGHGHGTHVSGIIAAQLNGTGVAGVAPDVQLYSIRVLDKNGGGFITSIVKGILWCAKNDIRVANMSLGGPMPFFPIHWAVKKANKKGVLIVAAAGNSGKSVGYPGGYKEVITVSASDSTDRIAEFSSRGSDVDFIAPGVKILSTILDGKYAAWSGTSMATPHVTGLAALAISLGASNPEQIRTALKAAAEPLPGLSAKEQGAGIINAAKIPGQ
ncbi:MAG: S8 family peptidase [Elusimicrobia bacterium]|nr:S8 family peptidase [Elusimicrobiota bacterium]